MENFEPSREESVEELADYLAILQARLQETRRSVALYEAELMRKLAARNATEMIAGPWLIRQVNPPRVYEWLPDRVRSLKAQLPEYDRVVDEVVTVKVDTRKMLSLAQKRGGEFKQMVDASYVLKSRGVPHIELEEREL